MENVTSIDLDSRDYQNWSFKFHNTRGNGTDSSIYTLFTTEVVLEYCLTFWRRIFELFRVSNLKDRLIQVF